MARKRNRYSATLKAKVSLEAVKEQHTTAELARGAFPKCGASNRL